MTAAAPPLQEPVGAYGAVAAAAAQRRARNAVLLADPAVAGTPVESAVRDVLGAAGCAARTRVLDTGGDIGAIRALTEHLDGADLVVAVGGGTVLDQAKLAAALHGNPAAAARIDSPQRSGSLVLPAGLARHIGLAAVPTTLGTGSERGCSACVASARGKRIVEGICLRPDAWAHVAEATETLPAHLVAEGVFEALFRTVGPCIGDPAELPAQDGAAEDTAASLVRAGNEAARLRAAGERAGPELRLRIAGLSGYSHSADLLAHRMPFPAKGWPLANELSWALGLRKVPAAAAVLPPLWQRIADGDHRLGSAPKLHRMWRRIRDESPGLPQAPAEGIAALVRAWGIDARISAGPEQIRDVAARAVRAWGAGLPMLGGLTTSDVNSLLTAAAAPSAAPTEQAGRAGPATDRRCPPDGRRLPEILLRDASPTETEGD
ncbi:hypothetical protein GCM10027570_16400 [Streptomonospora sediminis]